MFRIAIFFLDFDLTENAFSNKVDVKFVYGAIHYDAYLTIPLPPPSSNQILNPFRCCRLRILAEFNWWSNEIKVYCWQARCTIESNFWIFPQKLENSKFSDFSKKKLDLRFFLVGSSQGLKGVGGIGVGLKILKSALRNLVKVPNDNFWRI